MSQHDSSPSTTMLNKVPAITIYFWIIKVLATTVGETAADLLATRLNFGLTVTSWIMSGVFIAALIWQMRTRAYAPTPYWLTVVLISVVGTLVSDNLVDGLGISVDVARKLVQNGLMDLSMFTQVDADDLAEMLDGDRALADQIVEKARSVAVAAAPVPVEP